MLHWCLTGVVGGLKHSCPCSRGSGRSCLALGEGEVPVLLCAGTAEVGAAAVVALGHGEDGKRERGLGMRPPDGATHRSVSRMIIYPYCAISVGTCQCSGQEPLRAKCWAGFRQAISLVQADRVPGKT